MKTVILAGGRGTRLAEETHAIPKPMVLIGGRPILWHIMQHYAAYGYTDFVVALGYRGYVIKEYFANHLLHECDVSVDLASGTVEYLSQSRVDWKVTLIDTGEDSMTGGRLRRLAPLLTERFLLTYGDGLSDVPVDEVVRRHEAAGALATVTAVHPPPRFGSLGVSNGWVDEFREKPGDLHDWINGGYFVVEPEVLDLIEGDAMPFESAPLTALADRGKLAAYQHDGFWMPMDTVRERDELNRIWDSGRAPWRTT
ncbi:glucose-1-phosphate cytidylyltransferase [Oryzobacter telluris]|uniref:glucose-1-phosphate cytidylyltransferase n=1 Tax=Oryzobacter telluris TaxID=3149179 RepID=UPI00370DB2CD